jgi:hypothetical protein
MIVTKQDILNYGLILPEELLTLEDKYFFVFYYHVIEEQSILSIHSTEIVKEVNVSLYRTLRSKKSPKGESLNIGFFSNTFETRDGLFYLFLRTYNLPANADKLKALYSRAVEKDKIIDLNVSTNSIADIYTSDDFRRVISYYCSSRLQTIMQVYDLVNESMKNRLSKSLYGDSLKKVVSLIISDGGVLPEIGGTLRFMVIGEHANLTAEQQERLAQAKMLLRSMIPVDKIYSNTGWAISSSDGKWRTNIADNDAKILKTNLYPYKERDLYIPTGQSLESILPVLKNPQMVMSGGYNGRLIEVFSHPTLYNYYPRLALMPILYWYGENGENADYYFSPDERGGYIIINGSRASGDSLSILLHEIQHYIQNQEDFARGGNQFLATFVASVGSSSVRKIFACVNKFERYFREYMSDESSRLELLEILKNDLRYASTSASVGKQLIKMLSDSEEFQYQYKTINFYLVLYVSEKGDFSSNSIISFIESKIPNPEVVYELFQNISEGYGESKKYREKLLAEGYTELDIRNILFKGYQNLYGEMESRSVQASRYVESQFKNYFYLTRWEITPIQQLTVIDGVEEIIECENIKAALETKDDSYVLHFKKGSSCVPFLHELGHIVHDCLNLLGNKEAIESAFNKDLYYDNLDEWFVSKFLAYLKSNITDRDLLKDLKMDLTDEDEVLSKMLDDFFAQTEYNLRLRFLQTILSINE